MGSSLHARRWPLVVDRWSLAVKRQAGLVPRPSSLVLHTDQIQPGGRRGRARCRSITGLEDARDIRACNVPLPTRMNVPTRFLTMWCEESRAADGIDQFLSCALQMEEKIFRTLIRSGTAGLAFRRPRSSERRSTRRPQGSEIMLADDQRRRARHRLFIERKRIVPHIPRQKRRTDRFAIDAIPVSLGARRVARMEIGRRFHDFEHAH